MAKQLQITKHLHKYVAIKWLDSVQNAKVWHSFRHIKGACEEVETDDHILSTGYLVHESKRFVHICASMHFAGEKPEAFGSIFSIPKGCIIWIKRFDF